MIDAVDAFAGFQCADDSAFEGATNNNMVSTASPTSVASQFPSTTITGLAMCPSGDKDTYRIEIPTTASLYTDRERHADCGQQGQRDRPNLPSASSPYFVQLHGQSAGENNYQLALEVIVP